MSRHGRVVVSTTVDAWPSIGPASTTTARPAPSDSNASSVVTAVGSPWRFALVVASGGVHVMAGIYFKLAGKIVELSGYLRVGGAVTVLGVITVTVEGLSSRVSRS